MRMVSVAILITVLVYICSHCEAHNTYYGHYQQFYRRPVQPIRGPPQLVYLPPLHRPRYRRPVYRPPVYYRPLYRPPMYRRPMYRPHIYYNPVVPQSAGSIFNLLLNLPMSFYNNYVCNVLTKFGYNPAYSRLPNIRNIPKTTSRRFSYLTYIIIRNVYYGLEPYWQQADKKQLITDVTRVTMRMAKDRRRRYSPANVLKQVLKEKLTNTQETDNVDYIYNVMKQIRAITVGDMRQSANTMVQNSCDSIQGQFYCSYISKLTRVPSCSSAYFSAQLWTKCCQTQNALPQPVSTSTASTSTARITTPTTTASSTKECGISSKNPASKFANFSKTLKQFRIVGGVNTELCEYPWMVRLQVGNSLCGGTIIDETHVMTAGHCVTSLKPADIEVNVAEYNYEKGEAQDQMLGVTAINRHPDFRVIPPDAAENDIAILTLDQPLNFTDCVHPVCLPKSGDSAALNNAQCTTLGWGTTTYGGQTSPILQEVTMPTFSGPLCDNQYNNTTPTDPSVQICAGRPSGGADSCQGDSGGPLFCPVDGKYVQYGIVSYGEGCAKAGNAGVYTDVSAMTSFINSVIQ